MQRGSLLLSTFKYIPIAFVMVATLHDQMLWKGADFFAVLLHLLIWFVLIVGWLFRVGQYIWTQKKLAFKPSSAVLPLCLVLLFLCDKTDAPVRALFWTHKRAFAEALELPSPSPIC